MIELRPFDRAGFERLIGWVDSPDALFDWTGHKFSHPLDEAQLERHMTEEEATARIACTAVTSDRGEPVGHIELWVVAEDRAGTIVRVLVAPDRRRAGIGRAIVSAMLERAFGDLGLHRVELRTFQDNAAALRLYEGMGFVREGTFREAHLFRGRYRNVVVLSLLEDEWQAT